MLNETPKYTSAARSTPYWVLFANINNVYAMQKHDKILSTKFNGAHNAQTLSAIFCISTFHLNYRLTQRVRLVNKKIPSIASLQIAGGVKIPQAMHFFLFSCLLPGLFYKRLQLLLLCQNLEEIEQKRYVVVFSSDILRLPLLKLLLFHGYLLHNSCDFGLNFR